MRFFLYIFYLIVSSSVIAQSSTEYHSPRLLDPIKSRSLSLDDTIHFDSIPSSKLVKYKRQYVNNTYDINDSTLYSYDSTGLWNGTQDFSYSTNSMSFGKMEVFRNPMYLLSETNTYGGLMYDENKIFYLLLEKHYHTYNENKSKRNIVQYEVINSDPDHLVPRSRIEYLYNSQGLLSLEKHARTTVESYFDYDYGEDRYSATWEEDHLRKYSTYFSSGNLNIETFIEISDSDYDTVKTVSYSWNASNQLVQKTTIQRAEAGDSIVSRLSNLYDSSDRLISKVWEEYTDSIEQWTYLKKLEYEYSLNGNLSNELYYDFDLASSTFLPSSKTVIEYDTSQLFITTRIPEPTVFPLSNTKNFINFPKTILEFSLDTSSYTWDTTIVHHYDTESAKTKGLGRFTSSLELEENSSEGDSVLSLPFPTDGTNFLFTIEKGNQNNSFRIDQATGTLYVNNSTSLDFESNPKYELSIVYSDADYLIEYTISISISNLNEPPYFTDGLHSEISITEEPSLEIISDWNKLKYKAVDPEGDEIYYRFGSISSNYDELHRSLMYSIDSLTGIISINKTGDESIDFEQFPYGTWYVDIIVSDGIYSDTILKTIELTDVNEAPSELYLENDSLINTSIPNSYVSKIFAFDEDLNDTLTFKIDEEYPGLFLLSNDTILLARSLQSIGDSLLDIKITVTDKGGLELTKSFSIRLSAPPLAPPLISSVLDENLLLDVTAYPNPTIEYIEINSPSSSVEAISLFTTNGKYIKTFLGKGKRTVINVEWLPTGYYILKIRTKKGYTLKRMLKG